jgi:O-antigen ligase
MAGIFSLMLIAINLAATREDTKRILVIAFIAIATIEFIIQLYQLLITASPRPSGTFFNPNFLAQFYSVTILLSVGDLFSLSRRRNEKIMSIIAIVFCSAGMIMTASRGGFLSLIAGASFLLFLRNKKILFIPLFMVILFLVVPNPVRERFLVSADIYRFSRIDIWISTVLIFLSNPLGIGAGNFQYYYHSRNFPVYEGFVHYARRATTSHNEVLQVMVDQGIIGIVTFLFFVLCIWIIFIKLYRKKRNNTAVAPFLAALVSIGFHSFFDSVFHATALSTAAALITGVLLWDSRELERGWINNSRILSALKQLILILLVVLSVKTFVGDLYYKKGLNFLKEDKYTEAEKYLEISEKLEPDRPSLSESQAALQYRRFMKQNEIGALEKAVSELDEAVEKNPMNFNYYVRRANLNKILIRAGIPEIDPLSLSTSIWDDYVAAMEINPYSVATLKYMADFLIERGNIDAAVSILRKAITIEPGFNRARVMLGDLYADDDGRLALWMYRLALNNFIKHEKREMTSYERAIIMIDREKVEVRIRALEQVMSK